MKNEWLICIAVVIVVLAFAAYYWGEHTDEDYVRWWGWGGRPYRRYGRGYSRWPYGWPSYSGPSYYYNWPEIY